MSTDTAMYSVNNNTMQVYLEFLNPSLSLADVLNVTAYAVMSCGMSVLNHKQCQVSNLICLGRVSFCRGGGAHMGDLTQPQQKYAGTGENYNIAIAVIFYPRIKTL